VLVKRHDEGKPLRPLVSGICGNCRDGDDTVDRCLDVYRKVWPNLRSVEP
jgi:hypothetical protein